MCVPSATTSGPPWAAAGACPPCAVIGVGLGGTSDKAAYLAKRALLRPVDAYFFRYPAVTVEGTALRKAKNGNPFPCSAADGDWRVYGPGGEFLLLGRCEGGVMKTVKSFF